MRRLLAGKLVLTTAVLSVVVLVASFLPAPAPVANADPLPVGPPRCVPDPLSSACTPLEATDGVDLTAVGVLTVDSTATLSLISDVPPCETAASDQCFFGIRDPQVYCVEIPFGDTANPQRCHPWHDTEWSFALDASGGKRTPTGELCSAEFNYAFANGNDWADRAPNHLTCELKFAGIRPFPLLTSSTWLLMTWAIDYCLVAGEATFGNGFECLESERRSAAAWVQVLGPYHQATPIAECEATSSSNQITLINRSRTEGPNPFRQLTTEVILPAGVRTSGSLMLADEPGTYTFTVDAGLRGWDDTDSATCTTEVDFEPPDDDGGNGAITCGGELPTVIIADGDKPTEGDDVILGSDEADTIDGLGGDDIICGAAGNDTIAGGRGSDRIYGDLGNDRLYGAQGHDEIEGGDGHDTIHGNRGNDTLDGGPGDDRIFGYAHNDTIDGGDGNDRLHGNFGDDTLNGGPGDDRIFGYGDNDTIGGGPGNDLIVGNFDDDTLDGGSGNDIMYGADGIDTVEGGQGDDEVAGNSGNDVVRGGPGNDTMDGGINLDECDGGDGTDTATRCETVIAVP